MKRTLMTAAALAACVGAQLFAQNAKEDIITVSMTVQKQISVSTSRNGLNQGTWDAPPQFYKTGSSRMTQADLIRAIGFVLHKSSAYYSGKAVLELVQGELGGFFNVAPDFTQSFPISGSTTNTNGISGMIIDVHDNPGGFVTTLEGLFPALANGRHFDLNPNDGDFPPGHNQPWGQIFIKDPGRAGFSANDPLCENVTFFFAITVEECYDCFYLNSFISDAAFTFKAATGGGPPCCSVPENLLGSGKDKYYMTLDFDDTINNPYLDPANIGGAYVGYPLGPYPGIVGVIPFNELSGSIDGLKADFLPYTNNIRAQLGRASPFEVRFRLNGIVTYNWNMKFVNSSDAGADFVGTASYPATGYGFIQLFCSLLNGTITFNERIVKAQNCCLDIPWFEWWYGVGWDQIGNSAGRPTPVNTPASLSYHSFWDEEYEPGEQWDTNPPSPTGDFPI